MRLFELNRHPLLRSPVARYGALSPVTNMSVLSSKACLEEKALSSRLRALGNATDSTVQVTAVGDPVTDILVRVTHEQLALLCSEPGGSKVIDHAAAARLRWELGQLGQQQTSRCGGSAANVVRCVSQLLSTATCRCDRGQKVCE